MPPRFALILSLLWLACAGARAEVVALACAEECSGAQFAGLELQLRGHGVVLTSRPAPVGFTPTARAADARRVHELLGAHATLWVEHEPPLRLRAYSQRSGSIHEAPLPAQVSALEPGVFAAVAGSVALEALTAVPPAAVVPAPAAVVPAPGPGAVPPATAPAADEPARAAPTDPISAREREKWPAAKSSSWSKRVFIRAGVAVGFANISKKTKADRAPSPELVSEALAENGYDCDFTMLSTNPPQAIASNCGVAVRNGGVTWSSAIDLAAGLNVTPAIALAATARIDPKVGMGTMAHALLGLQVEVALLQAKATGFWLSAALGFSVGQVQVRPPSTAKDAPYARSGLYGARAGVLIGYRFLPRLGIVATPVVHAMFPDTLWVLETNFNLEVRI
jgi:hypothetical protein